MPPFELLESPTDDLSYDYVRRSVFGGKLEELSGIRGDHGGRTMLALMLSDQCPWGITVHEPNGTVVRASGSVLSHAESALPLANRFNPKTVVEGTRSPVDRFPRSAVREALINAVAHRDYSLMEDVIVIVTGEGMSIVSPGPAYKGPGPYRNPNLIAAMEAFRIKGYQVGGLRNIAKSYSRSGYSPRMVSRSDSFEVFLPAINRVLGFHDSRIKRISDYMRGRGGVSAEEIAHHMVLTQSYTGEVLAELEREGVVFSMFTGSRRRYYLCDGREGIPLSEGKKMRMR